jgi:hypothetical protein
MWADKMLVKVWYVFLDRKHIKLFNGLPKTHIQCLQNSFVICNFHMIVPDINKNVGKGPLGQQWFQQSFGFAFARSVY